MIMVCVCVKRLPSGSKGKASLKNVCLHGIGGGRGCLCRSRCIGVGRWTRKNEDTIQGGNPIMIYPDIIGVCVCSKSNKLHMERDK